ncbi:hypothetical protein D3C72_1224720 [compost metagenome]
MAPSSVSCPMTVRGSAPIARPTEPPLAPTVLPSSRMAAPAETSIRLSFDRVRSPWRLSSMTEPPVRWARSRAWPPVFRFTHRPLASRVTPCPTVRSVIAAQPVPHAGMAASEIEPLRAVMSASTAMLSARTAISPPGLTVRSPSTFTAPAVMRSEPRPASLRASADSRTVFNRFGASAAPLSTPTEPPPSPRITVLANGTSCAVCGT